MADVKVEEKFILDAIWLIYSTSELCRLYIQRDMEERPFVMIGDLRTVVNALIRSSTYINDGLKPNELSARRIGVIVRKELNMVIGKRRGEGYPLFIDREKVERLIKLYRYLGLVIKRSE